MTNANPAHWPVREAITAHLTAVNTLLSQFPPGGFTGSQAELLEARTAWWNTVTAVESQLYWLAHGELMSNEAGTFGARIYGLDSDSHNRQRQNEIVAEMYKLGADGT